MNFLHVKYFVGDSFSQLSEKILSKRLKTETVENNNKENGQIFVKIDKLTFKFLNSFDLWNNSKIF